MAVRGGRAKKKSPGRPSIEVEDLRSWAYVAKSQPQGWYRRQPRSSM